MNLTQCLAMIDQGEVIGCAAEGVWGLSCDPFNASAVDKLLALKQREADKGLILVVGSIEQFKQVIPHLSDAQYDSIMNDYALGKLSTWLTNHHNTIPDWVTGGREEAAIRLTHQPQLTMLCERFGGALISTSANPSSEPPALTQQQVSDYFPELTLLQNDTMREFRGTVSQLKSLVTGEVVLAR